MKPSENKKSQYKVLGIMSGTSMDGVDLAFCSFSKEGEKWSYRIEQAETIPYSDRWLELLVSVGTLAAIDLAMADVEYGQYLGEISKEFLSRNNLHPDFIASHGHTIFHAPEKRFTYQIGKGSGIAAVTGLPVVSDFRALDVALRGQGAPLVPIGDKLLFSDYEYCLNLGGFGNISFDKGDQRIAFDVCPVNIVMNPYAEMLGVRYDEDGNIARRGVIHEPLLHVLNDLAFYSQNPPKSLGKEWVLAEFLPLVEKFNLRIEDKLRTISEHVSFQIASVPVDDPEMKMLITGGGALNNFLIENIRKKTKVEIILPDLLTIHFKEALIFAFLGVLRWRNEPNCLRSVTGAAKDNVGGSICFS